MPKKSIQNRPKRLYIEKIFAHQFRARPTPICGTRPVSFALASSPVQVPLPGPHQPQAQQQHPQQQKAPQYGKRFFHGFLSTIL